MNKKYAFLIIVCIISIIIAGFIIGIWNTIKNNKVENYTGTIKEITSQTKIIDANIDHNQALDVAEYAVAQGVKIPKILINFDTHSDIYLNYDVIRPEGAGIGNWINEYFAKNNDAEILYWVMPKEEATNINMQTFFAENDLKYIGEGTQLYGNSIKNLDYFKFIITPLTKKAYEQNFLLDTETGTLNEYDETQEINKILFKPDIKYKKIKIITCTEETLPDFKDENVFLSIDADYLSNSGFDTAENFKILKTSKGIEKSVTSMIKTINDKNIKPQIISLTLSPQFLPEEHHKQVSDIFNKIISLSDLKDALATYKRSHPKELDQIWETYKNSY